MGEGYRSTGTKRNISNTQKMTWSEQIGYYIGGDKSKIKHSDTFVMDSHSKSYIDIKYAPDLPLAIPIGVIGKARSKKDVSHSVSDHNISHLDEGVKNASAIIIDDKRNSLGIVTDKSQNGKPVVLFFEMNVDFDGDRVHKATSIHIRQNIENYYLGLTGATILIKNKNKFTDDVGSSINLERLQQNNKLVEDMITHPNANVKKNISETSENTENETKQAKSDTAAKAERERLRKMRHGANEAFATNNRKKIFSVADAEIYGIIYTFLPKKELKYS